MKDKTFAIVVGAALFIVVASLAAQFFLSKPKPKGFPPLSPVESGPVPTLTEEQIETAGAVKTSTVIFDGASFSPASISVGLNDQVVWSNEGEGEMRINGSEWRSPPIGPGERFIRAFTEKGSFSYSLSSNDAVGGTVVVE